MKAHQLTNPTGCLQDEDLPPPTHHCSHPHIHFRPLTILLRLTNKNAIEGDEKKPLDLLRWRKLKSPQKQSWCKAPHKRTSLAAFGQEKG